MQTVGAWRWTCWLADLNTTVGGLARCTACVCHIVLGRFVDLEYANCGSLSDLAGRFKYYGCWSWKGHGVCDIMFGDGRAPGLGLCGASCFSLFGKVSGLGKWTRKVQQHHRIGSRTNLQVGVLRNCRF